MPAVRTQVPTTREELTAEWLNAALHEAGVLRTSTVIAVEVTEIGIGRGYVCLTLRVQPTYDRPEAGAPASFVAKIPNFVPMPDEATLALVEMLREIEVNWYRDLSAECPLRVPRCYWAAIDPDTRAATLLLEDMGDLRVVDQSAVASVEDIELAVVSLARMAGRWWEDSRVKSMPWIHGAGFIGELWQERFANGWAVARKQLAGRLPAGFEAVGDALSTGMAAVFLEAAASASTLVHGDYRTENFLFGTPGSAEALCVLDWQLATWGSGLYDLSYLLSQSLDVETRREHEPRLVRLYHDTLVAAGVTGYPFSQCLDDYARGMLCCSCIAFQGYGIMGKMIADGPGDVSEEERDLWQKYIDSALALIDLLAARSSQAIMDNNAGRMLPA